MAYNPNKSIDTDICKGIEKLYNSLKRKGITLRGIELSKSLTLFGTPTDDIVLDVGLGYNRKHIQVNDLGAMSRKPPLPVANPPFGLPKANPDPKRKANT